MTKRKHDSRRKQPEYVDGWTIISGRKLRTSQLLVAVPLLIKKAVQPFLAPLGEIPVE
jgi:hypothetical protein